MDSYMFTDKMLKVINKRVLKDNEIKDYIVQISDDMDLGEYLTHIYLNKDVGKGNLGLYNFDDKSIKIDVNKAINFEGKKYKNVPELSNVDKTFFINMEIICSIIHETTHALQNLIIHEENFPLVLEYCRELNHLSKNKKDYIKYYPLLSFEREAMANSYLNLLNLINYYFFEQKDLFNYYLSNLDYTLRYGYNYDKLNQFIYPNKTITDEMLHEEDLEFDTNDLFYNLMLGFKVSHDEYMSYFNSPREIITKKMTCK